MRRWILAIVLVLLVMPAATLDEHGTLGLEPELPSQPLSHDHPWHQVGRSIGLSRVAAVDGLEWMSRRAWAANLESGPVAVAERLAESARVREREAPQPAHDVVYVSSRFGPRFHPVLHRWRPHNGVDFAAPRGTPILAVADGEVGHSGWLGAAGRAVVIQHGEFSSHYAHMSRVARGLRRGDTVEKGDVIGYVGASGRATGHHLHFGVKIDEEWVDPLHDGLARIEPLEQAALAVEMERGFLEVMQNVHASTTSVLETLGTPTQGAFLNEEPFL